MGKAVPYKNSPKQLNTRLLQMSLLFVSCLAKGAPKLCRWTCKWPNAYAFHNYVLTKIGIDQHCNLHGLIRLHSKQKVIQLRSADSLTGHCLQKCLQMYAGNLDGFLSLTTTWSLTSYPHQAIKPSLFWNFKDRASMKIKEQFHSTDLKKTSYQKGQY